MQLVTGEDVWDRPHRELDLVGYPLPKPHVCRKAPEERNAGIPYS
jgi:hypothetical protein